MSFTSYDFIIFLPIVLVAYWIAPRQRWQNLILLISSCVFYGWLVPWHVLVLLCAVAFTYGLALAIVRWPSRATFLLWIGIALNLSLLAFVKYYLSINGLLAGLVDRLGMPGDIFLTRVILPLGLSFYFLKQLAYLIDVRRGVFQPVHDFVAFAAYVAFFPQVFSGPIDRPQTLLKQLQTPRMWTGARFHDAWPLLIMGLFKKIVVANTVRVIVDQIFLISEPSKLLLLVGGLAFTLQILADFSSYTDLSRGVAFLLGLSTMENFNRPYLALTPSDFWNRWHISLSSWLRDYIFFPMRRTLLRMKTLPPLLVQILPPLLTMCISGLWHGVGWQFLIWGMYYGVLIVIYQLLGLDLNQSSRLELLLAWLTMFALIVFGWLIFRSQSLGWLWTALAGAPLFRSQQELIAAFVLLVMIGFYAVLLNAKLLIDLFRPQSVNLQALYFTAAAVCTIVFMNSSSPDFIYSRF